MSQLGQPLRAEIEIVSLQRGEGDSLGARLASLDTFRQANVDMNPALLSLKFAVERRPSGQYVMALTSPQPVNEPFVDMLVELNWANGRLVREYTFLLDPPEYAGPKKPEKPAGLATAPAEQAAPEASAAEPASNVQGVAAEPAPVFAAVPLGPNVPGQATPSEPAAVPQGTPADEPTPAAAPVLAVEPKPAEPE